MNNQYLIPSDEKLVEEVAKSIARERMRRDALNSAGSTIPLSEKQLAIFDNILDGVFDTVWAGATSEDKLQKENYRQDAIAAIRTINLNLVVS